MVDQDGFEECIMRLKNWAALVALTVASSALAAGPVGNAANGERDFAVCRACHQVGPTAKNGIGPVLNGVVGRTAGTFPGYTYSASNKSSGITWTPEELTKYLANPQGVVPHTKMMFAGVHDPQKVSDIIAFLGQYGPDGQKKAQ